MSQFRTCDRPTRSGACQSMLREGEVCHRNHLDEDRPAASAPVAAQPQQDVDAPFALFDDDAPDDGLSFDDKDLNRLLDSQFGADPAPADDGWGPAEPVQAQAPLSPQPPRAASLATWAHADPAPTGPTGERTFQHETDARKAADEEYAGSSEIVVVEQTGTGMSTYRLAADRTDGKGWIKQVRDTTGDWHTFKSPEVAAEFVTVEQHLAKMRERFYKALDAAGDQSGIAAADKIANILRTLREERESLMPKLDLG